MSGESPVQGLEDFSLMRERAETKWVWVYVCDDFYEGWLPVDLEAESR